MESTYRVKKARKWYKVYEVISGSTVTSGMTYYQAKKLAKYLNE